MELLRFITAGSVDDGKSTFIGRLLYDSSNLYEDTIASLVSYNQRRGQTGFDLALVTDGLKSEREQGITIDVAYRYFATAHRKFIIADTPGHEQYTRNMVTGASTADLAVLLIDATQGLLVQTRRHLFLATLLGISHVVIAVNKMDLVRWSSEVFQRIADECREFCQKLTVHELVIVPVSALDGDNIVVRSSHCPWYTGPTILGHLETVHVASKRNQIDFRLPIQLALRPDAEFRGYAGRICSGHLRVGDEVLALPSRRRSIVSGLTHSGRKVAEALHGQSVVVALENDIDLGRGDMLVRPGNQPMVAKTLDAVVCWMDERRNLTKGASYLLLHTTRKTKVSIERIRHRISVDSLHREDVRSLQLNEIGRITLQTAEPIFYDEYRVNRETGSFLLVDELTLATVAVGMLRFLAPSSSEEHSPNTLWDGSGVSLEERIERNGHRPLVVWMTGLSGSGKSTLAGMLERLLHQSGISVVRLDGDNLRHGLNGDLGFTDADRRENLRRAGHVAKFLFETGHIVLCSFISPLEAERNEAKEQYLEGDFVEVYVRASLAVCEIRDPKGLYRKARLGLIKHMTGIDSLYEVPLTPDLVVDTENEPVRSSIERLHDYVLQRLYSAEVQGNG